MKQYAFALGSPIRRALLLHALLLGVSPLLAAASAEAAAPNVPASSKAVRDEDGKYLDAKGVPTYKIGPDGKVDWYTFSGFRRTAYCRAAGLHLTKTSRHGRRGLKRAAWAFEARSHVAAEAEIKTRLRASRVPTSHTRRSDPEAIVSEPRSPYCLRRGQAMSHESACIHFPSAAS